jgi:hypothetical protein
MDLRLAMLKAVSFYLLHNVLTLNQCRKLSCGTVVCKHVASYQGYPSYRWDLIWYAKSFATPWKSTHTRTNAHRGLPGMPSCEYFPHLICITHNLHTPQWWLVTAAQTPLWWPLTQLHSMGSLLHPFHHFHWLLLNTPHHFPGVDSGPEEWSFLAMIPQISMNYDILGRPDDHMKDEG